MGSYWNRHTLLKTSNKSYFLPQKVLPEIIVSRQQHSIKVCYERDNHLSPFVTLIWFGLLFNIRNRYLKCRYIFFIPIFMCESLPKHLSLWLTVIKKMAWQICYERDKWLLYFVPNMTDILVTSPCILECRSNTCSEFSSTSND